MLYVIGVTCVYGVYDQQFPLYYASLFPTAALGNQIFGYLNSFQVFIEAGMMFLAPFIVNKLGPKKLDFSGAVNGFPDYRFRTCQRTGRNFIDETHSCFRIADYADCDV